MYLYLFHVSIFILFLYALLYYIIVTLLLSHKVLIKCTFCPSILMSVYPHHPSHLALLLISKREREDDRNDVGFVLMNTCVSFKQELGAPAPYSPFFGIILGVGSQFKDGVGHL